MHTIWKQQLENYPDLKAKKETYYLVLRSFISRIIHFCMKSNFRKLAILETFKAKKKPNILVLCCLIWRIIRFLHIKTKYNYIIIYHTLATIYKPRLVYFLPHFWRPYLCFQGGCFQKILSFCMVSIQERVMMARVR